MVKGAMGCRMFVAKQLRAGICFVCAWAFLAHAQTPDVLQLEIGQSVPLTKEQAGASIKIEKGDSSKEAAPVGKSISAYSGNDHLFQIKNPTRYPFVLVTIEVPSQPSADVVGTSAVRIEPGQKTEARVSFLQTTDRSLRMMSAVVTGYFETDPTDATKHELLRQSVPILQFNPEHMQVTCERFDQKTWFFRATTQKPEFQPTQDITCKNFANVPIKVSLRLQEKTHFCFNEEAAKTCKTKHADVLLPPMAAFSTELVYHSSHVAGTYQDALVLITEPVGKEESVEPTTTEVNLVGYTYSSMVQWAQQDPAGNKQQEQTSDQGRIDFGIVPQNWTESQSANLTFSVTKPFVLEGEMNVETKGTHANGFLIALLENSDRLQEPAYSIQIAPNMPLGVDFAAEVVFHGVLKDETNPQFRKPQEWRFALKGALEKPIQQQATIYLGKMARGTEVKVPLTVPMDLRGKKFTVGFVEGKSKRSIQGVSVFPANENESPKGWDGKTLFLRTTNDAKPFDAQLEMTVGSTNPDVFRWGLSGQVHAVLLQPEVLLSPAKGSHDEYVTLPWPVGLEQQASQTWSAEINTRNPDVDWVDLNRDEGYIYNGSLSIISVVYRKPKDGYRPGQSYAAVVTASVTSRANETILVQWPLRINK